MSERVFAGTRIAALGVLFPVGIALFCIAIGVGMIWKGGVVGTVVVVGFGLILLLQHLNDKRLARARATAEADLRAAECRRIVQWCRIPKELRIELRMTILRIEREQMIRPAYATEEDMDRWFALQVAKIEDEENK